MTGSSTRAANRLHTKQRKSLRQNISTQTEQHHNVLSAGRDLTGNCHTATILATLTGINITHGVTAGSAGGGGLQFMDLSGSNGLQKTQTYITQGCHGPAVCFCKCSSPFKFVEARAYLHAALPVPLFCAGITAKCKHRATCHNKTKQTVLLPRVLAWLFCVHLASGLLHSRCSQNDSHLWGNITSGQRGLSVHVPLPAQRL